MFSTSSVKCVAYSLKSVTSVMHPTIAMNNTANSNAINYQYQPCTNSMYIQYPPGANAMNQNPPFLVTTTPKTSCEIPPLMAISVKEMTVANSAVPLICRRRIRRRKRGRRQSRKNRLQCQEQLQVADSLTKTDCITEMNDEDSDNERAKFIQRIIDFVQVEKEIETSSEDESSDEYESDGNPGSGRPDRSQPEKRRRSDHEHNSDVDNLHDKEVDKPENGTGGNNKLRKFVDVTGVETHSVETLVTCPGEPKVVELSVAEPIFPRRKPGSLKRRPLKRRPKLMCKLNLDDIDVPAVSKKRNSGNSTPRRYTSAGVTVPVNVNLPQETDDENFLLDEDKILDMFQDGMTNRQDICRTPQMIEKNVKPINKKSREVLQTKNVSLKKIYSNSSENRKNLSDKCGLSAKVEKPSLVKGSPKQSIIAVAQVKDLKSQNSSSKKTSKEGSTVISGDESDFVSKKTDCTKPLKSQNQTPEEKSTPENGSINRKKLLKGPKSSQNVTSSEKKSSTGISKLDAAKKPQENFFTVEKYVQKSPKSLSRIPLTQEAILARSQVSSSRLSLTPAKKLPSKDAAKDVVTAENEKTARLNPKENAITAEKTSRNPKNDKPCIRPQTRSSKSNENVPFSSKTSTPNPPFKGLNNTPLSPKKSTSKSLCSSKKLTTNNENISEKVCDNESQDKLFSRPIRSVKSDNIPSRNIIQGNRVSSPLSDFATRRNISTPRVQSAQEETQKDSRSEKTFAKLGQPNCEEPVYINWNHSNIPSVVNPEGMSLCKEFLTFYRKDLDVNEVIVCQLGKLDPLVLSEASKSRASPETPLSKRLSDIQIPSRILPKEVLCEIDDALNAD